MTLAYRCVVGVSDQLVIVFVVDLQHRGSLGVETVRADCWEGRKKRRDDEKRGARLQYHGENQTGSSASGYGEENGEAMQARSWRTRREIRGSEGEIRKVS